jgi:2-polyprenyl-3-methyl-5-hydroxy-6-metoxy-1,4-benzoquinol methylase
MRKCPNCGSKDYSEVMREGEFIIVKCGECSLIYLLNPPDEKSIYEDYYEINFKKEDYAKGSKFDYLSEIFIINEQRIDFIKKLRSSGNILDIGCGSGLFLQTASGSGFDVYGIDVSNKALSFAREEFGLNVGNRSIEELSAEGKKFDIITLWHVLEHFLNPVEELKKVKNLLNKDGVCFIEVPNFNSIKFKLSRRKWKGGNHPLYHRTFFTRRTLEDTLKKTGFDYIERLKISYTFPNRNFITNRSKEFFNLFSMDAFLNYAVSINKNIWSKK